MTTNHVYAAINAYPSYLFYEDGRVWSKRSNKFLKPLNVPNGYQHVVLTEAKVKYRHALHRLVARAFHGEQPVGCVVNHKNGIKTDNSALNLEWVTQSANAQHAYNTNLRVINDEHRGRAAALGRAKRTVSDELIQKMKSMFRGVRGDIERIAKALGVSRYIVSYHINGASR